MNGSRQSLFLLYHELRPQPSSYTYALACAEFDRHLALFARLQSASQTDTLRPEITFDDGHVSNFDHALPALAAHRLAATFFITAAWTGSKAGYMTWDQLRALGAAGQQIGAHGMTHALLTHCSPPDLDRELRGARQTLEDGLGMPVTTLSLPGGRFNADVLQACRDAGYTRIFTSQPRAESIPLGELTGRFNIRGDMQAAWIERLLQPSTGILAQLERTARMKQAAKSLLGDQLYGRLWAVLNRQDSGVQAD